MKQKSLKTNVLMSFILTVANFLFPLITFSYVSRVLTPNGTGKVAFATSTLSYFAYIACLGIPAYGRRECSKKRDDKEELSKLVSEIFTIGLISTTISYVLLFTIVLIVPKFNSYLALFLIMGTSIILETIGIEWLYQGLEEYTYITIRSLIFKTISVLLTFLLIKDTGDYLWYGAITVFTTYGSYILNFINSREIVKIKIAPLHDLKKHWKPILVLFSSYISLTIYANFDTLMIGFISGDTEVGLYNAAVKIKGIILSFSSAVTTAIVPRMAYYIDRKQKADAVQLCEKSFRTSMLLALPVSVYVFAFTKEAVLFVCGSEFLDSVAALRVLIVCILPLMLTNLFGNQILIPDGKEKVYSQSVFIGMWINLILNVIMIPSMGAYGAAIGTLITECWNVFWMSKSELDYVKHLCRNINIFVYMIPITIGLTASISVSYLVSNYRVFYRLLFTAGVFFSIFYVSMIAVKEPMMRTIFETIRRKVKQ